MDEYEYIMFFNKMKGFSKQLVSPIMNHIREVIWQIYIYWTDWLN